MRQHRRQALRKAGVMGVQMTISNRTTLNDLHRMQVRDIAALPGDQLALLQGEAAERLRAARTLADWLDGAIALKYAERARAARRAEGKDTGTVRFHDGAVTIVADLPKRVDWDQAKLARIRDNIAAAGEDPSEFIDTTLRVIPMTIQVGVKPPKDGYGERNTIRYLVPDQAAQPTRAVPSAAPPTATAPSAPPRPATAPWNRKS